MRLIWLICFILSALALTAERPVIQHLLPAGGQAGQTVTVKLKGDFKPWPPQFWTDDPDISVEAAEEEGEITLKLPESLPSGPRLFRAFNQEGASEPRFFLVSSLTEQLEVEPNDHIADANTIDTLPRVINGEFGKRSDSDSYRINLAAGEWVIAELLAYRLRSSIDALIQIIDPEGTKVALNHDYYELDPFLAYEAKQSGEHIVRVMGFEYPAKNGHHFGGGQNCVYRLKLHSGPYVACTHPQRFAPGKLTEVRYHGWGLAPLMEAIEPISLQIPATVPAGSRYPVRLPRVDQEFVIHADSLPQWVESTNSSPGPQNISVPATVSGTLREDSEVDRYRISLEKDIPYRFQVQTRGPTHRLDPWLAIESLEGKVQTRHDDNNGRAAPQFEWTPKSSEDYQLAIGNLPGTGRSDFHYQITVEPTRADYSITFSTHNLELTAGQTNAFPIKITRQHGFDHPLTIRFQGLPVSVRQTGQTVPADGKETTLELNPHPAAPTFYGPVELIARDETTGAQRRIPTTFLGTSVNNGVPGGFTGLVLNETKQMWLTVKAAAPVETNAPPAESSAAPAAP